MKVTFLVIAILTEISIIYMLLKFVWMITWAIFEVHILRLQIAELEEMHRYLDSEGISQEDKRDYAHLVLAGLR